MSITPGNMQARPASEVELNAQTTSIATTPVAGQCIVTNAGYINRVFVAAAGSTSGTITCAVSVNNSADICNGLLLLAPGSNARQGASFEFQNGVGVGGSTSPVFVNEGDCVTFSCSGGTGSSIGGAFGLVVRAN